MLMSFPSFKEANSMAMAVSRRTFTMTIAAASVRANEAFPQSSNTTDERSNSVMTQSDNLAKATVRIVSASGEGKGSGFHFIKPEIIVSAAHVVDELIAGRGAMTAHAETGAQWNLKLLAASPPNEFDYAVMEASGAAFAARVALNASSKIINGRGLKILFAGYPHGIDPLLVQTSEITSPTKDDAFSFSGMVHGGNSGGPVADYETLEVLGIVTKRRFFGDPQMRAVDAEMKQLQDYLTGIRNQGSVVLMGVNFAEFAFAMSRIASLTNDVIRVDSTTGIGIGNSIVPVLEKCRALKLL
jgi:V8-like Glu-specific endopeptidase